MFSKTAQRRPSDSIGPGGRPMYGSATSGKALPSLLLVLVAPVGIQELPHRWGSFWFILLPVLVAGVVWLALAAYIDHLITQGRYDQALRLVPLAAVSGSGRSQLRGGILTDAGRYDEAERILRQSIDRVGGRLTKVEIGLALEDLGNVLMDTGRFEEAQGCFRRAAGIH